MASSEYRLGTLISSGGTTVGYMIQSILSGIVPMDVACVISSNPAASGIEKARKLGIPVEIVNPNDYQGCDGIVDQYGFGQELLRVLKNHGATVVTQNGWLPKTPEIVIEAFPDSIFNQHPGPKKETRAMHGLQPHAVILYLSQQTGRNVGTEVITHRVTPNWDEGTTVGILPVPILDINETPETLQQRALPLEHALQVFLLQQLTQGNLREVKSHTIYAHDDEQGLLKDARVFARKTYPNG